MSEPVAEHPRNDDVQTRLRIMQMDCPTEEALLRKKLAKLSAVSNLEFNLIQRVLTVTHTPQALGPVLQAVRSLGFDPEPIDKAMQPEGNCCSSREAESTGGSCCAPAPVTFGELQTQQVTADGVRTSIRIMQMDCPVEEGMIRKKLDGMSAVKELDFNLMQRVLTVVHAPDALEPVLAAIRSLGFEPELPDSSGRHVVTEEKKKTWWPLALAGVAAIAAEAMHWTGMPEWLEAALALAAVAACGLSTYKKGWIALRNGNLNINALMSIAVTGALALGQWPEAAMVMVLFTIAELIEAKSLDRARNAIGSLMKLTPETATVQQPDGSWKETEARSVSLNSVVRVKPGERIALDGTVVRGRTAINQAPITGESLPVDKGEGDPVFAGTVNGSGGFEYRVTAAAGNTTLARIIHAVEEAQGAKAPTQRFVDRFAQIYTPVVFAIAVAVAVLPPLIAGESWQEWIYKALVMLVIACPCALVISTPVTIVSGLTAAARRGILIKGGVYLEEGRKLKWLALDKTGTLTHGKPVQTDAIIYTGVAEDEGRKLAVSLAGYSDHPVSQAVSAASDGIQRYEVENFEALPGRGVRGVINGQTYSLGNLRLAEETVRCPEAVRAALTELETGGKTVIMLCDTHQVLGLFAVADTVKESSREAISQLHSLGVKTLMLTGDNAHTAQAIAGQVGIDEARGDQLPEDKLRAVETFTAQGTTGMVGDGINDAPALARADIGFAMGAMGTDTAIETADVALMDDDLRKIPAFVRLSRQTYNILVQNIVMAIGIKAVFLALTIAGMGTMWMAVFADVGASLLVVANGLRLLRK
ncbi:heavy metal translocating P-type ATPase [Pantoea brenneri]|uniref:Heavy metal translocating P-type ATPase n=2 Tax=Erwiniaceae TaxID=1903409 RepID=A0A7Y6NJ00_9GAMM|nr:MULTISPECIES: heavy metal translocating P-type ATPase [Erwiniaceae]MBO0636433.1 heavy metal translocating P-type ATPase [Pantoea agglomerans]MBZ6398070.1 heavy metal translocating P-type ATPase [Pantoea sp.]MBZ6441100.1 heavy metal translocating P-type ATPase [Pantoea sp.]MEB6225449.1 heavy metal translocating P-type ATPase [Pantoea anthophila]NEH20454.1 heavy metal translocating P-type ATPase [Pantoea agglomerans]